MVDDSPQPLLHLGEPTLVLALRPSRKAACVVQQGLRGGEIVRNLINLRSKLVDVHIDDQGSVRTRYFVAGHLEKERFRRIDSGIVLDERSHGPTHVFSQRCAKW